jgi:protein-S-isoprenylcysteine O-methyltransferase Ste14
MNTETIFRILTLVLVLPAFSVSGYYRRRANVIAAKSGQEKIDRKPEGKALMIILRSGGLLLWGTILAYVINPAWFPWMSLQLPLWLRWIGAGVSFVAAGLLIWMFRTLGNNITDTVVTRQEHALVMNGPYRWIRHPLYSFGTLFFLGLSLVTARWSLALISVLAFILLAIRTRIEEEKLVDFFGEEYRAYRRRTGKFFPRMSFTPNMFRSSDPDSQLERG